MLQGQNSKNFSNLEQSPNSKPQLIHFTTNQQVSLAPSQPRQQTKSKQALIHNQTSQQSTSKLPQLHPNPFSSPNRKPPKPIQQAKPSTTHYCHHQNQPQKRSEGGEEHTGVGEDRRSVDGHSIDPRPSTTMGTKPSRQGPKEPKGAPRPPHGRHHHCGKTTTTIPSPTRPRR